MGFLQLGQSTHPGCILVASGVCGASGAGCMGAGAGVLVLMTGCWQPGHRFQVLLTGLLQPLHTLQPGGGLVGPGAGVAGVLAPLMGV